MAEGKKATAAEIKLRVEQVLRIILDGAQFHDVVQYAAEQGWGVRERQVREYIGKANDLLVLRQKDTRRKTLARHLARREALYARCVNAADFRTALAVLADLAKLRGLYPEPKGDKPSPAAGSRVIVVNDDGAADDPAEPPDSPPPDTPPAGGGPAGG